MRRRDSDYEKQELARERAPASARELATTLLLLTNLGLARRELGMCLGPGLQRRLFTASRSNRSQLVWNKFWAKRHAQSGHDKGCYAFGVSIDEFARVLRRVDRVGISPLLLEAFQDAALELNVSPHLWSVEYARETVEIQVRRRISPV